MKILIAVLAKDRVISVPTARMLLVAGADRRVEKEFLFVQHVPVDSARNRIIDTFLEGDFDWLISTDDDQGTDKNVVDLCFLGKDIIFLPTPIIQDGKIKMNVHNIEEGTGLIEIALGGTGTFLLSRKAAETIPKPLFKFSFDKSGTCILGEDLYFCKKAKKYFPLFAHYDYLCSHMKTMDLLPLARK